MTPTPTTFNKTVARLALAGLLAVFSVLSFAAEPINTLEKKGLFGYDPSGIAIRGADTVAYFTENKYVPGTDDFTTQWQGATWKFSSQEHLDLFNADPNRYAPQYGGYCAYGVAQEYLVKIEPENFSIVDDKLYLNYSDGVQRKWEKDISGFISKANQQFQPLLAAED
ncbi:MAG: YHS domain-containing (seleno)protein [Pseudomonadota bacterium]